MGSQCRLKRWELAGRFGWWYATLWHSVLGVVIAVAVIDCRIAVIVCGRPCHLPPAWHCCHMFSLLAYTDDMPFKKKKELQQKAKASRLTEPSILYNWPCRPTQLIHPPGLFFSLARAIV